MANAKQKHPSLLTKKNRHKKTALFSQCGFLPNATAYARAAKLNFARSTAAFTCTGAVPPM